MFNKILMVVEEDVDIHNFQSISNAFSKNFSADYSLHFSKGPLDVLDHSSQKFAFGSKLGIDLTQPYPEEIIANHAVKKERTTFNLSDVLELEEIKNVARLNDDILFVNIEKNESFSKIKLEEKLRQIKNLSVFKLIFLFNVGVDLGDYFTLVWLLGGNLEPDRDVTIMESNENSKLILVDATFKTEANDNFKRDWPNVVTMDLKTIQNIDKKWESLGLGEFIKSPSLKFLPLVKGVGAVRE
jgi:4-hydroxy-3-polyprenylbenzoate decarboxylase